ncbi:MAG: hypothetical protein TH68_00245 [Candidatus Synechococcus spongiarum 142]|uniref:Uncharacterized protein n=1 Tax=Candidatus Synechococcus spongiarum 142 TaxID=1608213 RepID=A0A6N3X5V1_9SYNE|nr:MAG: hypothetical protein TH68_00245 [Candidatus Synechococcus spongiarum 142]
MPASSKRKANRLAVETLTMPRGAIQPRKIFWGQERPEPMLPRITAKGRTTNIRLNTQAMPLQPRGLRSFQVTSAASRGNSRVTASWAS